MNKFKEQKIIPRKNNLNRNTDKSEEKKYLHVPQTIIINATCP